MSLVLRDADSGQIDHMAADPTHGPHHTCSSSSWLGARGPLLAIGNVSLDGGTIYLFVYAAFDDVEEWEASEEIGGAGGGGSGEGGRWGGGGGESTVHKARADA